MNLKYLMIKGVDSNGQHPFSFFCWGVVMQIMMLKVVLFCAQIEQEVFFSILCPLFSVLYYLPSALCYLFSFSSHHSAHSRSSGVVILRLLRSPSTSDIGCPKLSTTEASSVNFALNGWL